jgi:hypothetical protein
MLPINDFFAFTGEEELGYSSPVHEKKKKKKKKLKKKVKTELSGDGIGDRASPYVSIHVDDEDLSITEVQNGPLPSTDGAAKRAEVKATASELNDLLGMNDLTVAAHNNQSLRLSDPAVSEKLRELGNDDDNFLNSMDSFVTDLKKEDDKIQSLLQTYQQTEVKINGMIIPAKQVQFELQLEILVAGQSSSVFKLEVKGSAKFQKIIDKLMQLFNQNADPQVPPSEWSSLTVYIKNVNTVIDSSMRCTSLLLFQNQLVKSTVVTGFCVQGIITTKEYAEAIYNEEKARQLEDKKNSSNEESNLDEVRYFSIQIEDKFLSQRDNSKAPISLDDDGDTTENATPKVIKTELSIAEDMQVSEIITLYKYKVRLPRELTITLKLSDGRTLDEDQRVKCLPIKGDDVLPVDYSLEELHQIYEENGLEAEDFEDLDDEDDDEDDDIAGDNFNISGGVSATVREGSAAKEDDSEYFTIFVAGKDKKRYKVRVKPSTKIADISQYYIEKAGLAASTKVTLLFDDEPMSEFGVVGDTELEDEFMVDAIID